MMNVEMAAAKKYLLWHLKKCQ